MRILKTVAVAAIGYAAYRAWQRRQGASQASSQPDEGETTSPHGDPVLAGEPKASMGLSPQTAAQSSRGFGAGDEMGQGRMQDGV